MVAGAMHGFSLIEILLVIAIMGLLVSVVVVNVDTIFGGAQASAAETFVKQSMKTPLTTYKIQVGSYPTTAEGLRALVKAPGGKAAKWHGPYLDPPDIPKDPWGNPYQYRSPGAHNPDSYDCWSFGADGVESGDDIGNWE